MGKSYRNGGNGYEDYSSDFVNRRKQKIKQEELRRSNSRDSRDFDNMENDDEFRNHKNKQGKQGKNNRY